MGIKPSPDTLGQLGLGLGHLENEDPVTSGPGSEGGWLVDTMPGAEKGSS